MSLCARDSFQLTRTFRPATRWEQRMLSEKRKSYSFICYIASGIMCYNKCYSSVNYNGSRITLAKQPPSAALPLLSGGVPPSGRLRHPCGKPPPSVAFLLNEKLSFRIYSENSWVAASGNLAYKLTAQLSPLYYLLLYGSNKLVTIIYF